MECHLGDLLDVTSKSSRVGTTAQVSCLQVWWSFRYRSPEVGLRKRFKWSCTAEFMSSLWREPQNLVQVKYKGGGKSELENETEEKTVKQNMKYWYFCVQNIVVGGRRFHWPLLSAFLFLSHGKASSSLLWDGQPPYVPLLDPRKDRGKRPDWKREMAANNSESIVLLTELGLI